MTMGCIFISNRLLQQFFVWAASIEMRLFGREAALIFPSDPMHQLLIHGFGAGVLILGATLIYGAKHPRRLLPFILFDALGRLFFSSIMFYYVMTYSLLSTIFLFGVVELMFGLIYIWGSWFLKSSKWKVESAA